jgi:hypothetical protein
MEQELLNKVTQTIDGHEVRNLRWIALDNIIVGQVKDPVFGKPSLHDGFCSCQWNRHGFPLKSNKGRNELKLNII